MPLSWKKVKEEILDPMMPEPKAALEALLADQRAQLLKNFLESDHRAIEEQAKLLATGGAELPELLKDPTVREWLKQQGAQTLP